MAAPRVGWRTLVAALLGLAGLGAPGVAAAQEVSPSPALTVNPPVVSAGDRITVVGTGWPGSQLVDLSLCGNGGDGGSASCNRAGSATVGVGADGRFGATLVAVIPPVACPCVVRGTAGGFSATQPIAVNGAPTRTEPAPVPVPVATAIAVDGSGPPRSWFGGSPEREVTVLVENPSEGVARGVRVELRWGSGATEQSRILDLPDDLPARGRAVAATTVSLGALTWGDVDLRARVVTTGEATWVSTATSSYPWGLVVVAVLLVQLVVVAVVRRNRRRRLAREAELAAGVEAGAEGVGDGGPVDARPAPGGAVASAGEGSGDDGSGDEGAGDEGAGDEGHPSPAVAGGGGGTRRLSAPTTSAPWI